MIFPSDIPNKAGTQLMTVNEVAHRLNVSRSTVYAMRKDGLIPQCVRFGGTLRWNQATIENWIDAGCPEGGGMDATDDDC